MESKPLIIYYNDADGNKQIRCKVPKWEFSDKAMSVGEQYVSFSIDSEKPIQFAVGDYCIYRGCYFYLNVLPTTEQKAEVGGTCDALKYDSVRFDSDSEKLGRVLILDITPTTGDYVAAKGTNYTGSASFQLACHETTVTVNGVTRTLTPVCYLANIIKANLDRAYPKDGWQVHVNLTSTTTKYGKTILATHTDDKVLSFNGTTVASALAEVNNTFKLDYFVKGRDIYIGYTLSSITAKDTSVKEDTSSDEFFYFGYGKGYADKDHQGKALFDIKRNANSNQQIITRLRAMGSTRNMPYRYYNKKYNLPQSLFPTNLQLPDTFETPSVKATNNTSRKKLYPFLRDVKGDTNDAYIDKNDDAEKCVEGMREGRAMWDGSDANLEEIYPTIKEGTYRDLRAAEQKDSDGYTEKSTTKTDGNGKHSFLNYEDNERVDEVASVDTDANIGDGIDEDPAASARGWIDIPQNQSGEYIVNNSSVGVKGLKTRGSNGIVWEGDLGTVDNQYAGEYTLSPNFANGFVIGAKLNSPSKFLTSVKVWYCLYVYAKGSNESVESEIYSYAGTSATLSADTDNYSEIPILAIPQGDGKITLKQTSSVRVRLVVYTSYQGTTENTYAANSTSIAYYIGKTKNSAYTATDFTAQMRWSPVDASTEHLNKPFHIIIKDMGFDLKAQFNGKDEPCVEMQDGYCAGYKFKISDNVQKVTYTKNGKSYIGYKLSLTRASDSSTHTYFPSTRNKLIEGDHYILTGIQMPDVYVKMAETRLLIAATQYLADNSETKYTYEPSIDNIYLARNYDRCKKDGDVTKSVYWNLYAGMKFPFRGLPETGAKDETLPFINITIESLTIKEEDGYTPKVEMTLNDDIDQSTYQKITTAVNRIYDGSLMNEFLNGVSGGTSKSDMIALIQEQGKQLFLSKTSSDTAKGDKYTFEHNVEVGGDSVVEGNSKVAGNEIVSGNADVSGNYTVDGNIAAKGGITIGPDGSYSITKEGIAKLAGAVAEYLRSSDFSKGTGVGFDGAGFGITKDAAGKYTLEIDNLVARMKMIVADLEVHEMSFIGGTVVMSSCGNRVAIVEALDGSGNVIATANSDKPTLVIPDGKVADKFRCYFLASDGDRQIKNEWTVGQLARCKTNNIAKPGDYANYQNREYWRLVVAVSDAPVTKNGKSYHYIDLSNSTSKSITLTEKSGTTHLVTLGGVCSTMTSLPYAGDNVIGFGHCWDAQRQNMAILSMLEGGWVIYKGISAYDLPKANIVNKFGIDEAVITTDHLILRPYAAPSEMQTVAVVRGPYDDKANYGHNDITTCDGQTWIGSGIEIGKTITGQKPSATSPYWSLAAAKGIQGIQGPQGEKGDGYAIAFLLNGVPVDVINFDTIKGLEGTDVSLEADFFNNAIAVNVNKATITCYDKDGNVLGSPIETTNAENIIVDAGNLYLSQNCQYITTMAYDADGKLLVSKSIGVVKNGVSVGVEKVTYKVINSVDANAPLNWDAQAEQTAYPTQKPDKGKYCYVMTIVTYSDGTSTNTVSTSYTPMDGNDGTSVTITDRKVEYAGGDSGTTAPTTGWDTKVPSLEQGKYLWTRTTITYSDGTPVVSYSVGRIGKDGSKGGTTHILYASTANPQSENDVRTTVDDAHQYYGTYQDTELNDKVSNYGKVTGWVLIKGAQGIPGNDGHTPVVKIGNNGNWTVDGVDSGVKAQGDAGHTPKVEIIDGYWYIDGTKSIKAQGDAVTVKSVAYKVLNDQAAGATLDWSKATDYTTLPDVKPSKGKYCYIKTIVTYTDGKSTETISSSYTPTDGIGVTTSTVVTYARTSTNAQPSSFPLTSVPTDLSLGEYLWSKTVVTYQGVNTETTTSIAVSRVGKDGAVGYSLHMLYSNVEKPTASFQISTFMQPGYDYIYVYSDQSTSCNTSIGVNKTFKKIKGEPGVDGTQYKTVESYAYGDDNTTVPTTGWSDSISGGAQGKYLWNKEVSQHKAATDADWVTDKTTTHCIGYIAKDGEPGANFTGVLEYYKATEKNEAPVIDSSWQSTPTAAGWSAAKPYLWNYEIVTRDKGANITTAVHLDSVWGTKGDKGDSYSIVFKLNDVRVDVLNFDDVTEMASASFQADFLNQGVAASVPHATMTCYDGEGNTLGSPIDVRESSNIVADGGNLYLSKNCKTITVQCFDAKEQLIVSASLGVMRNTITYSLTRMDDTVAVIKPSDTSTSATFRLHYLLHYTAAKLVGTVSHNATIASITASIEGKDIVTTVNGLEGTLSGDGKTDYTAQNSSSAPNTIPVSVKLSDGTILPDAVPVTIQGGVAIDINNNINQLSSTVADNQQKAMSTITQKAGEISAKVSSIESGKVDTSLRTEADIDMTGTEWDANTFYPVAITLNKKGEASKVTKFQILVSHQLETDYRSGAGYGTHSLGFNMLLLWEVYASGWGARDPQRVVTDYQKSWVKEGEKIAGSFGQFLPSSTEFVYLRGGAKWHITVFGDTDIAIAAYNTSATLSETGIDGVMVSTTLAPLTADKLVEAQSDLLATGIDIDTHTVKFTGSQFLWRNSSGANVAYIDDKGNACFNGYIYAQGGTFTGTVTASTINGSTISGSTITSTSDNGKSTTTIAGGQITTNNLIANGGSIGGFNISQYQIGSDSIKNADNFAKQKEMSLYRDYIYFNSPQRRALLGCLMSSGQQMMESLQTYSYNTVADYGIVASIRNYANLGFGSNAVALHLNGCIEGLAVQTEEASKDCTIGKYTGSFLINGAGTKYYLPDMEPWDEGHEIKIKRLVANPDGVKPQDDWTVILNAGKYNEYKNTIYLGAEATNPVSASSKDVGYSAADYEKVTWTVVEKDGMKLFHHEWQTCMSVDAGLVQTDLGIQSPGDAMTFIFHGSLTTTKYANCKGCWVQYKHPRDW